MFQKLFSSQTSKNEHDEHLIFLLLAERQHTSAIGGWGRWKRREGNMEIVYTKGGRVWLVMKGKTSSAVSTSCHHRQCLLISKERKEIARNPLKFYDWLTRFSSGRKKSTTWCCMCCFKIYLQSSNIKNWCIITTKSAAVETAKSGHVMSNVEPKSF